jgi:hypothetical protein
MDKTIDILLCFEIGHSPAGRSLVAKIEEGKER